MTRNMPTKYPPPKTLWVLFEKGNFLACFEQRENAIKLRDDRQAYAQRTRMDWSHTIGRYELSGYQ